MVIDQVIKNSYAIYQGDCVELAKQIPDNSIHYSIFSPPFSQLYSYSNSERDMGNSKDNNEFYKHFDFLIKELKRIIMPGRLVSLHVMTLPIFKYKSGFVGIFDFRGDMTRLMVDNDFIFHSEVTIRKNPVIAMQRTKSIRLLHKQLKKDSTMSGQCLSEYIITFRKRGENEELIKHTDESFPVDMWQVYAENVWDGIDNTELQQKWVAYQQNTWMDINPSDTLQHKSAREEKDEKHICPLQLEVIKRCIELWTNQDDIVLSPFAGIGSETYMALRLGRRALGFELKGSYYKQATGNCEMALKEEKIKDLTSTEQIRIGEI